MNYLLLALGIVFNVLGQLLLKRASMVGVGASGEQRAAVHRSILSGWFVAGGGSLGLSMLLWVLVLRKLPLNVAHPITIGCCLVLVAVGSRVLWNEPLPKSRVAGIAVILVGVWLAAQGVH